jgi:hypothetical protein
MSDLDTSAVQKTSDLTNRRDKHRDRLHSSAVRSRIPEHCVSRWQWLRHLTTLRRGQRRMLLHRPAFLDRRDRNCQGANRGGSSCKHDQRASHDRARCLSINQRRVARLVPLSGCNLRDSQRCHRPPEDGPSTSTVILNLAHGLLPAARLAVNPTQRRNLSPICDGASTANRHRSQSLKWEALRQR